MNFDKIQWSIEYPELTALVKKDNSVYRSIAIFFLVLSILLFFLFPFVLFFTIPLTAYILYFYSQNKNKKLYAYLFKINKKECWYRPPTYSQNDPDYPDNSITLYLFEAEDQTRYELSETVPIKSGKTKLKKHFKVNSIIFNAFKKGDEAFFIFSQANDLLAYYYGGEIIVLTKTKLLSNGETFSISDSIPQELNYPPPAGYSII